MSAIGTRLFGGPAGQVFRGMATLVLGASAARAAGIVAIPALTRLYGPADFGVLAIFTALVTILAPLLTLRYAMALPLPRTDAMAMNVLALSAGLMAALSVLATALIWAFGPALLGLVSMEALAPWWWLIALGLVLSGLYELLSCWATRRRAYGVIARASALQGLLGAGVKVGLGLFGLKPLGLLLGQVITLGGGNGAFLRAFWGELRAGRRAVTLRRIGIAARRYRAFPIYRLPSQFLLIFSMQAPALFTAALYGAETAGQLGLALMALALPVSLIAQSAGNAYYAEISAIGPRDPAAIRAITRNLLLRMAALALAPAAAIGLLGEPIFTLFFGADWAMAGQLAAILSIYLFFNFISNPVQHVFAVLDENRIYLYLSIQRTILLLGVFLAVWRFNLDIYRCILIYSLLLSVHYLSVTIRIFLRIDARIRANAPAARAPQP